MATFAVVGVLLALDLAALAAVWVRAPASPVLADAPEPALFVSPTPVRTRLARPVELRLTWGAPPVLRWPGATGTVTSVLVGSGQAVRSGDLVARVDGVGVLALATAAPLYRPVGPGTVGDDVTTLTFEMARLGLLEPSAVGPTVTPRAAAAIVALNRRIGFPGPFLPHLHTAWLPTPDVPLTEVSLATGAEAPPRGGEYAQGTPTLRRAVAVTPDGAAGPPTPTEPIDGARSAVVGDARFALTDDDEVVASALPALGRLAPGGDSLGGVTVELDTPRATLVVPAGSVVAGRGGADCLIDRAGRPHPVSVVDGTLGRVEVVGDVPDPLVANPGAVDRPHRCG